MFCNDKYASERGGNRLTQPTVEKSVPTDGNLVLRKTMMERHKNVVTSDSQTTITEPDRYRVQTM